jgi:trans-2,3-dihydro-3-hydroxyanthranilate isomerase
VTGATVAAPNVLTLADGPSPEAIAACAGLHPADVMTSSHAPVEASLGNPVVIAEVAAEALASAAPDTEQFRRAAGSDGKLLLFLYAFDDGRVRARMFAPLAGITEDPATGAAAVALAALLLSLNGDESGAWDITQGVEMGRPSTLRTTATRTPTGIRATVGGACVQVLSGEAMV